MNLGEALRHFTAEMAEFSEDASLETQLIIGKVTGLSRPVLLSHPETPLESSALEAVRVLCQKRKTGYPLPYLLGEWEFYGHSFFVNPSVLIPRPETELLVEEALSWLRKHPDVQTGFDIGTGSGCIAISLMLNHPTLRMTAADISRPALQTARANAQKHHCAERFSPVQADLFSAFSEGAALICANLPYIPSETCSEIEPAHFEPWTALDGGSDGFELYRLLFQQLKHKIKTESLILCEIEYRQRELALRTAAAFFPDSMIRVQDDLAGQPRLLRIENR